MLAVFIVIATVFLVIWRPYGIGAARAATIGAVLALLTGVVKPSDLPTLWQATWNATLTLVALIIISLMLDAAGFFKWMALHIAQWGGGQGRRLLVLVVLFSALVAALFANDGGVLILTPIVLEIALLLNMPRSATLAYALAVGFVVDATSLPLPISNLTNIIASDAFGIGFHAYTQVMFLVNLAVVAACLLVLLALFWRHIPQTYDLRELPQPGSAVKSWGLFKTGWLVIPFLLAGAFLAPSLHIPLSAVVGSAALVVCVVAARSGHIGSRAVLRAAPWNVVGFSLAMYTVVYSLRHAGITGYYGEWLSHWAAQGSLGGILASGLSVAALSAGLNNLPALLTAILGIQDSGVGGHTRDILVYSAVVGADIGPKLTPIGSLATLLWLHVLRGRGLLVGVLGGIFPRGSDLDPAGVVGGSIRPVATAGIAVLVMALWVMLGACPTQNLLDWSIACRLRQKRR